MKRSDLIWPSIIVSLISFAVYSFYTGAIRVERVADQINTVPVTVDCVNGTETVTTVVPPGSHLHFDQDYEPPERSNFSYLGKQGRRIYQVCEIIAVEARLPDGVIHLNSTDRCLECYN